MYPDEDRFKLATESKSSVFPSTLKERAAVAHGPALALKAYESGDPVEAQKLSDATTEAKGFLAKRDALFELVQQCLKDATACEKMEIGAGKFLIADEWHKLRLVLQGRLAEHEAQTAKNEEGVMVKDHENDEDEEVEVVDEEEEEEPEEEEGEVAVVVTDPAAHPAARKRKLKAHKLSKGKARAGRGIGRPMRQAKVQSKAAFDTKMATKYTWRQCSFTNYLDSTFYYENGDSLCRACSTPVAWLAWSQHIHGPDLSKESKHEANVKLLEAGAKKQASLIECIRRLEAQFDVAGQTLHFKTKACRADFVLMCFECNVALAGSGAMARRYEEGFKVQIGDPTKLDRYLPAVAYYELDRLRDLIAGSFPEFGAIVDGSPHFAEAEAIMLRVVTKKWKIVVVVIRVALLTKTPISDVLLRTYLWALARLNLKLTDQRAIMMDRAAVNGAMVSKLMRDHGVKGLSAKCCSHTIVRVGTYFSVKVCTSLFSCITSMFQHPGNARVLFVEVFGEAAKGGGGVRWWISWEQMAQMEKVGGFEVFLEKVAKVCVASGWSEESSKKVVAKLEDPLFLAKAMVELTAQVGGGKPFVLATYTLELNGFGVVVAYDQIAKLEAAVDEGIPLPGLSVAAARAAAIVKPLKDAKDADVATHEAVHATAVAALAALDSAEAPAASVAPADVPAEARGGGSGRRVAPRQNYAALAGVGGAHRTAEEAAAKAEKAAAAAAVTVARLAVEKTKADRDAFIAKAGPLTAEQFEAYGRAAVQPGFEYFAKLFGAADGEMWGLKMAYYAATVFDALKLCDMTVASASLRIDRLVHFNFPEFTPVFLAELKTELPQVLAHAKKPFDWAGVPGAAEYDAALARKSKFKQTKVASAAAAAAAASSSSVVAAPVIPEVSERTEEEFFDWKQDPVERARRLWEWWVPRVDELRFWAKALRLVALVQPSSAEVERLFSQLKLIVEQIGVTGLEEGYEARTMTRVNVF